MIPSISVQGTSTTFVKHSVCDHKLTWNSFEERVRKRRAGTSAWGSLVNVVKYTLGIKNDLVQNLKWQHQTKPLKIYLLFLSKFFFMLSMISSQKISFEKTQELKYRKSLSLDENYAQNELI